MHLRAICACSFVLLLAAADAGAQDAHIRGANESKLVPNDTGAIFEYGASVAVGRKLVVVGVPSGLTEQDSPDGPIWGGAAVVFQKKSGQYKEVARLTYASPDINDNAQFGTRVATDGARTIVVTAPSINNGKGAAYVFEQRKGNRGAQTWQQVAKLEPDAGDGKFGLSVDIDKKTVVVGAPDGDGAVYVFTKAGSTWKRDSRITPGAGADGAEGKELNFGESVAISKNTIAVGAPGHDDGEKLSDSGLVQVFTRGGSRGGWALEDTLKADDQTRWIYLGSGVDIEKRTVVAASRGDFDETGAAYVFERGSKRTARAGWAQVDKLVAKSADAGDWAGAESVAISKKSILVGAPFDEENGALSGSAYLFAAKGGGYEETQLLPSDGLAGHQFGRAVALFKGVAVVGAYLANTGDQTGVGAAYVFE